MLLADHINQFNSNLQLDVKLPEGVEVMNPFIDEQTSAIAEKFYNKFYSDERPRKMIVGINPGRLGGGITGIPFTDPVKLENDCNIPNEFRKVTEPSAGFVYDVIRAFGGAEQFYQRFYIYAVCPLGFVKDGLNYNYYDDKILEEAVKPFIISSFQKILNIQMDTSVCFCLGNGKNYKFLKKLNEEYQFFGEVVPLPHPRWIVQYRRKRYQEFVELYKETLS